MDFNRDLIRGVNGDPTRNIGNASEDRVIFIPSWPTASSPIRKSSRTCAFHVLGTWGRFVSFCIRA